MPGKKGGSVNYCTMGSKPTDVGASPLKEQAFLRLQYHSQYWQLMMCLKQLQAHFLPWALDVSPCSYLPVQPSCRPAPGHSWCRLEGILLQDKAERVLSKAKFSDLISVMWIAVILSWSNLYPAQVAWEEEATAARSLSSPPSLALPGCSWGSALNVLSETQVGAFL